MDRRLKAVVVAAFMALALIVSARAASADDYDWLRLVCASWRGWPIVQDLLGCNLLPDDPSRAQG